MIILFKLLTGVYDSNIACHLVILYIISLPGVTIFVCIKDMFIMIRVNIILEIALYQVGMVCLITLLLLTQLVYLRKDFINFGEIKHVFSIIQPT